MAASLKTQFPEEEHAIDEFMTLMKVEREESNVNIKEGFYGDSKSSIKYLKLNEW